jgi:hypothetical protein
LVWFYCFVFAWLVRGPQLLVKIIGKAMVHCSAHCSAHDVKNEKHMDMCPFFSCHVGYFSWAAVLYGALRSAAHSEQDLYQPFRCASSFLDQILYIWTYACLHISFAINFKIQMLVLSYSCLYYSFAKHVDRKHIMYTCSWLYYSFGKIQRLILACITLICELDSN